MHSVNITNKNMAILKNIPSKVRKEVEDRDNTTGDPHQTSCVICSMLNVPHNEYYRREGKYEIAHYKTRYSTNNMCKENLVVMCKKHHQLQHQDLLEGRRIHDMMGRYLKSKYPDYYKEK